MPNPLRRQEGFTLLELSLYLGLAGFIVLSLSVFIALALEARVKNQSIRLVNQEGFQTLALMTQTIRNATGVSAPFAGQTGQSLSLSVADPIMSPTEFSESSQNLYVQEGGGEAARLNSNQVVISGLTFTNLSQSATSSIVRIQFSLSRYNPQNKNELEYSRVFSGSASTRQ
jgi:Tfp pilus assembly protein PilW